MTSEVLLPPGVERGPATVRAFRFVLLNTPVSYTHLTLPTSDLV